MSKNPPTCKYDKLFLFKHTTKLEVIVLVSAGADELCLHTTYADL